MAMPYSRALIPALSKLNGFSRNSYKLTPTSGTTYSPGDQISILLPSGLVNTRSFTLHATLTCSGHETGKTVAPPRHAEAFVETVSVDMDSVVIDQGSSLTSQLYQIHLDTLAGDKATQRGLLSLDGNSALFNQTNYNSATAFAAIGTTSNRESLTTGLNSFPATPIAIANWMGFLGTVNPSVLNTQICGQTRVTIRLSPASILLTDNAAAGATYTLSNVYATVDVFSLDDPIFAGLVNKMVAESENGFQHRFQRWISTQSGSTALNNSLKFNVSTESLDVLLATILPADFASRRNTTNGEIGFTGTSHYFTRGVTPANFTEAYFLVNSTRFPTYTSAKENVAHQFLNAYGQLTDTLGQSNPRWGSLDNWMTYFYAHATRFNMLTEAGEANTKSGLNTVGVSVPISYESSGSASGPFNIVLWAQCTSDFYVRPGRQVVLQL